MKKLTIETLWPEPRHERGKWKELLEKNLVDFEPFPLEKNTVDELLYGKTLQTKVSIISFSHHVLSGALSSLSSLNICGFYLVSRLPLSGSSAYSSALPSLTQHKRGTCSSLMVHSCLVFFLSGFFVLNAFNFHEEDAYAPLRECHITPPHLSFCANKCSLFTRNTSLTHP